jgi:hypothetical protein
MCIPSSLIINNGLNAIDSRVIDSLRDRHLMRQAHLAIVEVLMVGESLRRERGNNKGVRLHRSSFQDPNECGVLFEFFP